MRRFWKFIVVGAAVLGLAGAATGFALAQSEGGPDQVVDTDHDGLPDDVEARLRECPSSENPDSDGDHLPDGLEALIGTNICKADTDGDRLPDGAEVYISAMRPDHRCPHPLDRDSDGDGWRDGVEVALQKEPCDPRSHPRIVKPDAEA